MTEKRRDLPIFPRFREAWNEVSVKMLDEFLTTLRDYMSTRPVDTSLEIEWTAPDVPSKKTRYQISPEAVWPGAMYRVDAGGPVSVAMSAPLQWKFASGTLTFPSLGGIVGGATYRLRVIVREDRS